MNLHRIAIAIEYGSLAVYGLGVFGFFLFACSFIGVSFKRFSAGVALALVWPIFLIAARSRQRVKNKKAPEYIQFGR